LGCQWSFSAGLPGIVLSSVTFRVELGKSLTKNNSAVICPRSTFAPPTLPDLGINRQQSHRWQLINSLPDIDFEEYIRSTVENDKELTSAGANLHELPVASREDFAVVLKIRDMRLSFPF